MISMEVIKPPAVVSSLVVFWLLRHAGALSSEQKIYTGSIVYFCSSTPWRRAENTAKLGKTRRQYISSVVWCEFL
ncbi:hypothetical protein BJ138DRAFT_1158023 [Hygrophoropsis aurantiaca]|uniref:Uncharacterized protein n=1 Tax=Hygrophoropsis aurantiaca TaxID=72124 RepID=A0ACB8A4N5_9AGAM|nr:hypothetical protein BJ138DRAFT_1158023 [Hygrophoropsis aurantiaca]